MRKTTAALLSTLAVMAGQPAQAQQPAIPTGIKIIVPFAVGGSTDIMARAIASELAPRLGTTIVVENRTGAGSLIGADAVAKGPRDGSVLLFTTASTVTAAATAHKVPFDIAADLLPVAMLGEGPMVVAASTGSKIKSPADLVAAARAKPDGLTYGSAGIGTIGHLTAELINDAAKIQTRHIPYKGTSAALIDLAAGTIDWTVATYTTLIPQIKAGRVLVVGVTTQRESAAFPGVLPISSAVPGFDASTWVAIFAPPGTPLALVQRYNREINEVAKAKAVTEQMLADGAVRTALTPDEVAPKVRATYAMWKRLAADKKIVVE